MNKKLKEIRILNNWQPIHRMEDKVFQLTDKQCDITLMSYRQYFGPPDNNFNMENEYTSIQYEIIITGIIDKTKIVGEFLSDEWISSVNKFKKENKAFIESSTHLQNYLFDRYPEHDKCVEIMDENNVIYNIPIIIGRNKKDTICFSERWKEKLDDFSIFVKNNKSQSEWTI